MGLWGGIKSFFGPKKTTTSTTLDPNSAAYQQAIRSQAAMAANVALQGPGGAYGAAANGAASNAANQPVGNSWFTGPQSMSIGDQAAQFFNPYMSNVIDPIRAEYDRLRGQATSQTQSQATLANAYGGSRAALLTGSRLGQLDRGQAQQIGDLMYGGYNNALGMGTQYAEMQRRLQEQQLQEPLFRQQQAQQFLNNGMGPVGQTTVQGSQGGGFGDLLKTGVGLYNTIKGAGLFGSGGQNPMGGLNGYQMPPNANFPGAQPNPMIGNFVMRRPGSYFPTF